MVAAEELRILFPNHVWRLVCVDAAYEDVLRQKEAVWRVMQASKQFNDGILGEIVNAKSSRRTKR